MPLYVGPAFPEIRGATDCAVVTRGTGGECACGVSVLGAREGAAGEGVHARSYEAQGGGRGGGFSVTGNDIEIGAEEVASCSRCAYT